jgi:oxygen-independent coproporphyrinogen-3 oxidase
LTSLYVHIPFCERKCSYCDFYSVEEGTGLADEFLAALLKEIGGRADETRAAVVDTVFFGGGTPSLLTPDQLEAILAALGAAFRIAPDAEITLEANPGTVTEQKLRAFHALGVNRLSLGLQSFHDDELRTLGRIHDRAEAIRCLELARAAGFENVGFDLIYAIPGQTLADWEDNLRTAADLAPQHIAAYNLTPEEGTPLAALIRTGAVHPALPDLEAQMYERTMDRLGAEGYEHYEVSNYAHPGFRCRHNCAYWSHADYLGFGPSAHSFWRSDGGTLGRRWWNVADLMTYVGRLRDGLSPVASAEAISPREMREERILLGLRCGRLDLQWLRLDSAKDLTHGTRDVLQWMIQEDLASLREGVLRLRPKGFLVCDEICRRLLRECAPPSVPR